VTLYLISAETIARLPMPSSAPVCPKGDRSTAVAFAPKSGGPVGAYSRTLTPATAEPMSWLFR